MTATIHIMGICYEGKENAISGASLGPGWLRWGLENCETYSLALDQHLPKLIDHGDHYFLDLTPVEAEQKIAKHLSVLPPQKSLVLGGDHLITYFAVKNLIENGIHPHLLQFDAHLDQRDEFEGSNMSHATVGKLIDGLLGPENRSVYGARSCAPEETWDKNRYFRPEQLAQFLDRLEQIPTDQPIYVSFDIDVLDPGLVPSVSNPEPGGVTILEIQKIFNALRGRVVAADLVELVPFASPTAATAQIGGVFLRDLLCLLAS